MSYLFSLFDRSGINIVELSEAPISDSAKNELDEIKKTWAPLSKIVTRIRHNMGFHGGYQKQTTNGIKALHEIEDDDLTKDIVILLKMLSSFSNTLQNEIKKF